MKDGGGRRPDARWLRSLPALAGEEAGSGGRCPRRQPPRRPPARLHLNRQTAARPCHRWRHRLCYRCRHRRGRLPLARGAIRLPLGRPRRRPDRGVRAPSRDDHSQFGGRDHSRVATFTSLRSQRARFGAICDKPPGAQAPWRRPRRSSRHRRRQLAAVHRPVWRRPDTGLVNLLLL